MSEVKLNLVDAERVLYGTIHGSVADRCVAALSAEPETIGELDAALNRYNKRLDSSSQFAWFHSMPYLSSFNSWSDETERSGNHRPELDTVPWDSGIVVIDLAARIVAVESTYSQPGPEGEVFYHDGHALTDVPIWYRVPTDWLFVNSVDAYQWSRERRASERAANPAIDVRPILFGRPLLEFIVNACLSLPAQTFYPITAPGESENIGDEAQEAPAKEVSTIHARWLLTPREDLRGQAPRDVLLANQDFIDYDLHTRSLQWSLQNEGPPCLDEDSFAYRFAGFGTHEWVIYYDLVRYLIYSLIELRSTVTVDGACGPERLSQPGSQNRSDEVDQLIARLDQIKTEWLENPQPDLGGRIPAIIIQNERKRLPQAMRPHDMIIDDDCPMCQMMGDETSPLGMGVGFWHLDGSHMDDDFAFSWFKTRQEWEVEIRRREEFDREFDRERKERQERIARGEMLEEDSFFNPGPFGKGWGWFKGLESADPLELETTMSGEADQIRSDDSDQSDPF
ncbi:MAG: hypothetical protein QOJ12_3526 [Thermoleophilales bacterium]|nr:hypothetical protein [Thermoleophilales bacterium]